jgi:hypothetical protein
MDSAYKLHVKIGPAEFLGEGPEEAVKDAYQQFLAALPFLETLTPPTLTSQYERTPEKPSGVEDKLLEMAFRKDDDTVSLRHLPPADRASRAGDAAILILYGFKKLLGQDDVLVTKLNEALRTSGVSADRVDRMIAVHSQLYRKGGQRSGGRYALNNQGELQAENWLRQWFN